MKNIIKVLFITNDKKLENVLKFCFDGWGYEVFFEDSNSPSISKIIRIAPNVIVVDVHAATKDNLQICDVLKKDFATAYIPVITLINKKHLRQHLLDDLKQGVDDYLIKPPDPLELRVRIEMALKRSQHSFYASPLTGLPGGIVIENTLREKLEGSEPFVAGQVDIDNFKSFNDKYGYIQGDRVIMQTAYMLTGAVRKWGNKTDFVGHIGGDDFVIITSPERYNELCRNFICMFDTITPFHYCEEDRRKGHIMSKTRTKKVRKLPLMSVTIALVLKNSPDEVNNIIELNERMAEVKQYLKKIPGSKYMADRRVVKKDDHLQVQVFTNDESLTDAYKPLGQILIEKNLLTPEKLDEALRQQWKGRELLGQVLKDKGYITEEALEDALRFQESGLKEAG